MSLNTSAPTEPDFDNIFEAAYQTVGAASVCWESMSGTGVFQDDQAREVADRLIGWITGRMDPDTLALIFKAAWHQADRQGQEGRRTDAGIKAVSSWILGTHNPVDPDQLPLFDCG